MRQISEVFSRSAQSCVTASRSRSRKSVPIGRSKRCTIHGAFTAPATELLQVRQFFGGDADRWVERRIR